MISLQQPSINLSPPETCIDVYSCKLRVVLFHFRSVWAFYINEDRFTFWVHLLLILKKILWEVCVWVSHFPLGSPFPPAMLFMNELKEKVSIFLLRLDSLRWRVPFKPFPIRHPCHSNDLGFSPHVHQVTASAFALVLVSGFSWWIFGLLLFFWLVHMFLMLRVYPPLCFLCCFRKFHSLWIKSAVCLSEQ